ncbi:MAG TPA: hypothetical protein VI685_06430 [Candidatus Angelobacter sp.]
MKYLLWIGLGLLLLITIAISVCLWRCPHIFRRLSRAALHLKYSPSSDITFRGSGMQGYNSHGPRGSRFDGSVLKSSDCVFVERTIYRFPTAEDADAQFNNWVQSAVRVLKTDEDSSTQSRRAVFEGGKDGIGDFFNIIFKKEHSSIVLFISSKSLDHALLFEEQEKREFVDLNGREMHHPPVFRPSDDVRHQLEFGFCP